MGDVKTIRELGNQLLVTYADGSVNIAYPTMGGLWIVSGMPSSGGGSGEWVVPFSFDYVPSLGEFGPRSGVGVGSFHEGIDFANSTAVTGQPIPIIHAGTVQFVGSSSSYGNYGIIHHGTFGGADLKSLYAHFPSASPLSNGQTVAQGDIIGIVGASGDATGPHLHLETHVCAPGGSIVHNTNDTSSPRTAINPRDFFATYNA